MSNPSADLLVSLIRELERPGKEKIAALRETELDWLLTREQMHKYLEPGK